MSVPKKPGKKLRRTNAAAAYPESVEHNDSVRLINDRCKSGMHSCKSHHIEHNQRLPRELTISKYT